MVFKLVFCIDNKEIQLRIATILVTALLCFGWQAVAEDGGWISAVWTDDGNMLLTGAKYRGLTLVNHEDGTFNQITDQWKAGYRPDSHGELLAFTYTEDFDMPSCLRVHNIKTGKDIDLSCLDVIVPSKFESHGNLVFSNMEETFVMSTDGRLVDSFTGGAYIVLQVVNGFFWCDRNGRPWHRKDGKVSPVELPVTEGFAFSPTVSDDGHYVLMEERGGAIILYNVQTQNTHMLPDGDRPVFTEHGVLQLQLADDGHTITDCSILYTPITDGVPGNSKYVLEDLWPLLVVQIDFNPEHGLVMTTADGRVIEEVFYR